MMTLLQILSTSSVWHSAKDDDEFHDSNFDASSEGDPDNDELSFVDAWCANVQLYTISEISGILYIDIESAVDFNLNNNSSVILYTEENHYFDRFQYPHNCEDNFSSIVFSVTYTYFATYDTLSDFDANQEMDEPFHVNYYIENEGNDDLVFHYSLTEESPCEPTIEQNNSCWSFIWLLFLTLSILFWDSFLFYINWGVPPKARITLCKSHQYCACVRELAILSCFMLFNLV